MARKFKLAPGVRVKGKARPMPRTTKHPEAMYAPTAKASGRPGGAKAIEVTDPERSAHVVELLAEGGRIADIAEAAGFPKAAAQMLVTRLRRQYFPLLGEVRRLKTAEIIEKIDEKLAMVLEFIDPIVLANASASQLGILFGILSDKRQLLRGEPTQILSVQERVKLDELLPALLSEARRRGQDVELVDDGDGNYVPGALKPVPFERDYRTGGFRDRHPTPEGK